MTARRRFLKRAAVAGGAGLAFPSLVAAQGVVSFRWQSAWPAGHPFHDYALDFAAKVREMAGGDLKIEIAPLGAGIPATGLLEAVSSGKLDGAHGTLAFHYARDRAFGLWEAGPAFGMDANMLLAWHNYGGGRALLAKLYAKLGVDVVSFLYGPRPSEPLGWFKRRIAKPADFRRLRLRADGMAADIFRRLGAQVDSIPDTDAAGAIQAGRLEGADVDGPAVASTLGVARAAKVCMLNSFHRSAGQFELLMNKSKFEALPETLRAILGNAVQAASADLSWKAIERDSAAYLELHKEKTAFDRTPAGVLQAELAAFDAVAASQRGEALFADIESSQKVFAARAVRWQLDGEADRRMAYRHYFAPRPARKRR